MMKEQHTDFVVVRVCHENVAIEHPHLQDAWSLYLCSIDLSEESTIYSLSTNLHVLVCNLLRIIYKPVNIEIADASTSLHAPKRGKQHTLSTRTSLTIERFIEFKYRWRCSPSYSATMSASDRIRTMHVRS